MKKSILFTISFMLTTAVFCQFTMNSSYNLVPGENYRMDMYNEVPSMDPGPSGTNQTWDFSTISGGVYIEGEPSFCVDPAGTPYADSASVTNANLCVRGEGTSDEGPFVYYELTNSDQTMVGLGNQQGGGISFANYFDPLIGMEFPCSYGSNFSDTYEYQIYNTSAGMYFMKDVGTVTASVDAWGSITTPEAHYDNVIRLVTTTTSDMYMNFGAGWVLTVSNVDIHYSWMAENLKINVFSITEFVTVGGYSVSYLVDHNFPVGIKEQEEISFNLYPNPAGERVNIRSEKEMEAVSVFSMDGRMLSTKELGQGNMETSLDIKQYPKGMYLVEIRYGKGQIFHERLVKQ